MLSLIEWLSDNGSVYTADQTRAFAKKIGYVPKTTPIESPQSNGMAEAFVKTFKRDYARVNPKPDADAVLRKLDDWFNHYNERHPAQGAQISLATATPPCQLTCAPIFIQPSTESVPFTPL